MGNMYNTSCVLQGVRERVNMVFLFHTQYPLLTQSLHIPSLKKKKRKKSWFYNNSQVLNVLCRLQEGWAVNTAQGSVNFCSCRFMEILS